MPSLPDCTEYLTIIDTPGLLKSTILKSGHVMKRGDTVIRYTGGYCVVFPFETQNGKYAVRCWHANLENMQKRTMLIAEELKRIKLPYFVNFEYEPEGVASSKGIQPVVIMDWVDANPFKDYIAANLHDKAKINKLADDFYKMTEDLHKNKISHGDLQHGNILVHDNGEIVLVDYDSMCIPALEGCGEEIKGLEGYQAEARWKNDKLTPKADYFSEIVIYTSLRSLTVMPELWEKLDIGNTETLVFSAEDIKSKGESEIFSVLDDITELKPCVKAMKEAMNKENITDIKPLSEYLHPNDELRKQWADNGYRGSKDVDYTEKIKKVGDQWADNGYEPSVQTNLEKKIDSIKKKW